MAALRAAQLGRSVALVIFDLDGTLVDSVADISASANYVRQAAGLPALPVEELARYVGDGAARLMQRAMAGRYDAPRRLEGIDLDRVLAEFRAHYHEHCLVQTKPYPGVVETLAALRPLPMAIVSNKPEPMCVTIARGLGLSDSLMAVVGARRLLLHPRWRRLGQVWIVLAIVEGTVGIVATHPFQMDLPEYGRAKVATA